MHLGAEGMAMRLGAIGALVAGLRVGGRPRNVALSLLAGYGSVE